MNNFTEEELKARYNNAYRQWLLYAPRLQQAYEYTQPYRNKFFLQTPGVQEGMEVFDTTAVDATISFTSKMQTALTPIGQQFMRLTAAPGVPDSLNNQIDDLLASVNEIVWRYIKNSNFNEAINESYFDLCIGTGALTVQYGDDENPLVFSAHPLCNVFLERTTHKSIQNVWREHVMPVEDIKKWWPDAVVPDYMIAKDSNTYGGCEVKLAEGNLLRYKSSKDYDYIYVVMDPGTGKVLYETVSKSSAWMVYRWSVAPGETYGVGVATLALPSIRSLNKIMEFTLRTGAFAANPPFEYPSDSGWNPDNSPLEPGTCIPILNQGMQTGNSIRPINFGANFQISEFTMQYMINQINKIMFNDPLGTMEQPVRTATEMLLRQQDMIEKMGPAFGRLGTELLTRLMKRIMFILVSKGLIPNVQIDGKVVDLAFDIPLARSQGIKNISTLVQSFESMSGIMSPELAAMSMNIKDVPTYIQEQSGADPRLFKSPEEFSETIQNLSKQLPAFAGK